MAATFFILKAGIAPPDLAAYPPTVRLMFWSWIVDLGLKRKDWELARGLNAKGEPLPGIAPATRKHRRSAMTPSGKGDPSAPYLMPGRGLSRTRSLLAGKAHADYAEFYWRYDPHTGDQWGRVLAWHAARGKAYDVVGLSPAGIASVAREAQKRWRQWLLASNPLAVGMVQGHGGSRTVAGAVVPGPLGRTNLTNAVFGAGGSKEQYQQALDEGRAGGLRTQAEWAALLRASRPRIAPASPGTTSYSVRKGASNVMLQAVWSGKGPPPAVAMRRAAMPPAAPPVVLPTPKPLDPTPKPSQVATPPAFPPSTATVKYGGEDEAASARTRGFVKSLFGGLSDERIASVVGAPDGATVEIDSGSAGSAYYSVRHDDLDAMEGSFVKPRGEILHNPYKLYVRESARGKGVGAEIHGRRVAFGSEHGVSRLSITAARGEEEIGYVVWPGMGYDGKLPKSVLDKLPDELKDRTTIQGLLADEGGQKWWKEKGESIEVAFDLAPGSPSITRWATYWARRLSRNSGE